MFLSGDMCGCHDWEAPGLKWVEARDPLSTLQDPGRPNPETKWAPVSLELSAMMAVFQICPNVASAIYLLWGLGGVFTNPVSNTYVK
jgi:hypothetical protein